METATKITELLASIQKRHGFTDQELAEYVGVSRWTIYRIRRGKVGETVSTTLIGAILKEQTTQPVEQVA